MGNTFDVSSPTSQTENSFERNYWSHYKGYDLDRDGVGDVPFRPVSLFSYLAVENSATMLLLRSFVMELLDMAEQIFPTLTPSNLADNSPLMRPVYGRTN
jgi:nitrous oxidase accessory protein